MHSLEQITLLDNHISLAVLAHHTQAGEGLLVHCVQELLASRSRTFGGREGSGEAGLGGWLGNLCDEGLYDSVELLQVCGILEEQSFLILSHRSKQLERRKTERGEKGEEGGKERYSSVVFCNDGD